MKNFTIVISLLLLTFILCSCGGTNGGGASATGSGATDVEKSLFNIWKTPSGSLTLDLRGQQMGTPFSLLFTYLNGDRCLCNAELTGISTTGNYSLSSCTFQPGNGSGSDPGCGLLDQAGTFSIVGADQLTLCEGGSSCVEYQ